MWLQSELIRNCSFKNMHNVYSQEFQIQGSVLGLSWNETGTVATGFAMPKIWNAPKLQLLGWFHILVNSGLGQQLHIFVLIVSHFDINVNNTGIDAVSQPTSNLQSDQYLLSRCKKCSVSAVISQWFNECFSHCKSVTRRCKKICICWIYLYILLSYNDISTNDFPLGGMVPSEWRHRVRAVRGTPVPDFIVPGVNTTPSVTYHPPYTLSPFLLALSVPYITWTLWRCGQQWPYVRVGSLGTGLYQDCNVMGDSVKFSPYVASTGVQYAIPSLLIIHIIPSCQTYMAIDNPSHI